MTEAVTWEGSCKTHLLRSFRQLPVPDGTQNTSKSEETTTPRHNQDEQKDENVIDLAAAREAKNSILDAAAHEEVALLMDIRIKVDFLIDKYLDTAGTGGFGKDQHSPVFEQIWEHIAKTACEILQLRGALPVSPEMAATEVANLLIRKQADYGHDNISRFGRIGLMVRMHDKVARLENLRRDSAGAPNNESIDDNLLDLIGYSTIGKMWEDRTFMIPLQ